MTDSFRDQKSCDDEVATPEALASPVASSSRTPLVDVADGATKTTADEPNQGAESAISETPGSPSAADGDLPISMEAPKKKKRKSRPGKTRRAITGFEEFFADAPTTPAEHAEEKKLFSCEHPFAQRIEEAIQRYRQKRRFDSQRSFLFDKYLALGGIDSSQRMFQGLDPLEIKNMTNEEIRQMTARDVIHHGSASTKFYDPDEPGTWTVNFPIVVKGFLSRWVPENYPRSDQGFHYDNEQAAGLIHNFLSYIQMHDVCPEYTSQILEAKAVCGNAPMELRFARELYHDLQDSFNTAAKCLFVDGNVFEATNPSPIGGTAREGEEFLGQNTAMRTKKLDPFTQLVVFRISVMDVYKDTNHLAADEDPRNIHVKSIEIETYQVISVQRRKKKEKAMLEKLLAEQGLDGKVKPMGTMTLRPSLIEHAYSNVPHPEQVAFDKDLTEKIIMDDEVLAKVQPGMKLQLEVCKLNIGIAFIKKVLDVRVSFDTLLPQSLMLTWKEPVENERPAPSVENPGSEDKAIDADGV
ncbi:hypothetical protein AB5N19_10207 [Seiridium cardinale]